jgi:hypothetical protein
MPRKLNLLYAVGVIAVCLPAVPAQTTFPFQVQVQQDQSKVTVPNNSSVTVRGSGIGLPTPLTLTVTYTGLNQVAISGVQLYGSTDFTITAATGTPLVLRPGSSFVAAMQYKPSSAQSVSAQFTIPWSEKSSTSDQVTATGTIAITFTGVVANLNVYYALPANGNVTPLPPDGTLQFTDTTINSSTTATVIVANLGTNQGSVNGITVTGDAFQLVQLPLLPTGVNSGSTLTFGVMYSPKRMDMDTGKLNIQMGTQVFSANLRGSGVGPIYSYSVTSDQQSIPVSAGSVISFADAAVNETTQIVLQLKNVGNAPGVIPTLSIGGTGFRIIEAPPFPLTLPVNGAAQVKITFTPTQSGASAGRLFLGADYFDLAGNGLAPILAYTYSADGAITTIQPTGTVVFSPVIIGQSSTIYFTIANNGNTAAKITSIGIAGGASGVFRLSNAPGLPNDLRAGQSIMFSVIFKPGTVSQASATLMVNTQPFALLGFGADPPRLPSYSVTGMSGQVAPYSQPAISLELAQPYSAALRGTLTLTGDSALAGLDPAVQFSTGGRTVAFTIPEGQNQAVFSNGLKRVQVQTGTIAGTITLTPSFTTDAGVDVTPSSPSSLTVTVSNQPPVLLSAQVVSRTASAFTIAITGYSTTRSLSMLEFQFSGNPTSGWSGARVTVDVNQASTTWFSNPASQAYGGSFSASVPFTLLGSDATIDKLQGFSVVAVNSLGKSAEMTGTLP